MAITIADTKAALLVSKDGIAQTLLVKKFGSISACGQLDLSMVGMWKGA